MYLSFNRKLPTIILSVVGGGLSNTMLRTLSRTKSINIDKDMYTKALCVNENIYQLQLAVLQMHCDRRLIHTFIWKFLILFVDCVSNHWCIAALQPLHTLLIKDIKRIIS